MPEDVLTLDEAMAAPQTAAPRASGSTAAFNPDPEVMTADEAVNPYRAALTATYRDPNQDQNAVMRAETTQERATGHRPGKKEELAMAKASEAEKLKAHPGDYLGGSAIFDSFVQGVLPAGGDSFKLGAEQAFPIAHAVGTVAGMIGIGKVLGPIAPAITYARELSALPTLARIAAGKMAESGAVFGLKTLADDMARQVSGEPEAFHTIVSHVATSTLVGGGFGAVGLIPQPVYRIPAEASYGFVTTKLQGGSNFDAALNAGVVGVFGLFHAENLSKEYKAAALDGAQSAVEEALVKRGVEPEKAAEVADRFMRYALWKGGAMRAGEVQWDKIKIADLDKFSSAVQDGWKIIVDETIPEKASELITPPEGAQPLAPADGQPTEGAPAEPQKVAIENVPGLAEATTAIEGNASEVINAPSGHQLDIATQLRNSIAQGEAGHRIQTEDGEWIAAPSTFPEFFKNKGYTQKETLNIIDKYVAGKPLTDNQRSILDDLMAGQEADYNAELQRERERLIAAGEDTSAVDAAQSAGRSIAEGTVVPAEPQKEVASIWDTLSIQERKEIAKTVGWRTEKGELSQIGIKTSGRAWEALTPEAQNVISRYFEKQQPQNPPVQQQIEGTQATMPTGKIQPTDLIQEPPGPLFANRPAGASGEKPPSPPRKPKLPEGTVIIEVDPFAAPSNVPVLSRYAPLPEQTAGQLTAAQLREYLGKAARAYDQAEAGLKQAWKVFDKAKIKDSLDFMDRMEAGDEQPTPELQAFADKMRQILDTARKEVQGLGTGKLQQFNADYFPHIWEDPKKAKNVIASIMGKRPLEGSKAFLKQRSIETIKDGIEAGLVPVSYNPVDLVLLKMREMQRYVAAHRLVNAMKTAGTAKFVRVGQKSPEGWTRIADPIGTVYGNPNIPISEGFDKKMMEGLNKIIKDLDIVHFRHAKLKIRGAFGYTSMHGPIFSKFATPESVIAHELGHQLDFKYSLQSRLGVNPPAIKRQEGERKEAFEARKEAQRTIKAEFRAIADMRYQGEEASDSFKSYVRSGEEKIAVLLESYVQAPELFKEVAPTIYDKFTKFLGSHEELKPILALKPSLVLGSGESTVRAGGLVINGYYYAPADAAKIINNYLSPGLRGNWLYDLYRGAGNALNQLNLAISGFHAGFTTVEAVSAQGALGLSELMGGDPLKAGKSFVTMPFAPITTFIEGRKLLQSWYGTRQGDELTDQIANLMAEAGGRAKQDEVYKTQATKAFKKALKEGKYAKGVMYLPWAAVEQQSRPILDYLVPRMKLGVFSQLVRMEIERRPNMSHEDLRQLVQKIWDTVDYRMGQVVYDNRFMNRVIKDLAQAGVRSVGWSGGTIYLGANAAKEGAQAAGRAIRRKPTGLESAYNFNYMIMLVIVHGLFGAIYQYLMTGEGPQELKDLFYPRVGGLDKHGEPARVSPPTYLKDFYHYGTNPVQTVLNKLSPVNSMVAQMLANKDFYGTEIRHPDDPVFQQALETLGYLGGQMVPFSIRNLKKDTRAGAWAKIEPFVGITPAPYDVNMTPAEKAAADLEHAKIPVGARTKEQADRSKNKAKLRNDFKVSGDKFPIDQAVADGSISKEDRKDIEKQARMSSLERLTRHLSIEETISIYKKANPQEKIELERIMRKKRGNLKNLSQDRRDTIDRMMNEIMPLK